MMQILIWCLKLINIMIKVFFSIAFGSLISTSALCRQT